MRPSVLERRTSPVSEPERARTLSVAVFTTSYPRDDEDPAGRFVADAVERLRVQGLRAEVVHPELPGAGSVMAKLRHAPWRAPGFLAGSVRALRRVDCDLVHAHWLLSGLVAALAGRPFVLTLHGSGSAGPFSDVELARRAPSLVGAILRRARVVVCVSDELAATARRCGAANVRVIPNGIDLPIDVGAEADPPEVLYAGRLSPEKGIAELIEACKGLNLVVAGDGPLRELVPQALGFLPPAVLAERYSRAAVVVCPSRSEGFGVVCAEAMAHARPVVATTVGGLKELIDHERTGLLVEPGNATALRAAIERLLGDPMLRRSLGDAARADVGARFAWNAVMQATVEAYSDALDATPPVYAPLAASEAV